MFKYHFIIFFIFFQVNGRDVSNSSHEEAVEAFLQAEEPITVEVLRRGGGGDCNNSNNNCSNNSNSNSNKSATSTASRSSSNSIAVQTEPQAGSAESER